MKQFSQNDNNYAIAYYRYSSSSQNEASIEQQRNEAIKYAKDKGLELIKEYEDAAISGRIDKRPGYIKMLSEINRIKPSVLIIWKTDRLGRDKYELAIAKQKIKEAGCKVCCIAEVIPEDTPEGIILESLLEGMAAYYSMQLSSNVKRGMRSNAEKGLYNGVKILGYTTDSEKRNRADKHKRHYIIDTINAPIIEEMFDLCISGYSLAEISRIINAKGYRTEKGNKFTANGIRKILKNRAYIGEYRYGDIIIADCLPKIISEEKFKKVQEALLLNKRYGTKNTRAYKKENPTDFWLTGKIYCGYCGSTLNGVAGTGKSGKRYYYYGCNEHCKGARGNGCKKKRIKKERLERIAVKLIKEVILNSEPFRREVAFALVSYLNSRKDNNDAIIEVLEGELLENKKVINNIINAIGEGASGEMLYNRLSELEQQKKNIEHNLNIEKAKQKLIYKQENIKLYLDKYIDSNINERFLRDEIFEYYVDRLILMDNEVYLEFHYPYLKQEEQMSLKRISAKESLLDDYSNMDTWSSVILMSVLTRECEEEENCLNIYAGDICSQSVPRRAPKTPVIISDCRGLFFYKSHTLF